MEQAVGDVRLMLLFFSVFWVFFATPGCACCVCLKGDLSGTKRLDILPFTRRCLERDCCHFVSCAGKVPFCCLVMCVWGDFVSVRNLQ